MRFSANKAYWGAFSSRLAQQGLGISGKYYPVKPIPEYDANIGYTTPKPKEIFLAPFWHPMLKEFNIEKDEAKIQFIRGVHLHELMHQVATDFDAIGKIRHDLATEGEKQIFHMIANVIEDPAIEYRAQFHCGGDALRALHFTMATTYRCSSPIDAEAPAFNQFIHALIEYGDGGLLKGDIPDPEAKRFFIELLPIIDDTIVEPNGAKRAVRYKEIFDKTKPLWESTAADMTEMAKLQEELRKLGKELSKAMKGKPSEEEGEGEGEGAPSSGSGLMAKRQQTRKNLTGESSESGESGEPSNACGASESGESSESCESGASGEVDKSHSKSSEASESSSESSGDSSDEDDGSLSEADIEKIHKEMEKCKEESEREVKEDSTTEVVDLPEISKKYPRKISCENRIVPASAGDSVKYDSIVGEYSPMINSLSAQLKRVFRNDVSEKAYRNSGSVDMKRLTSSRKTAKVFTKRIDPSNKSDMAVLIMVDNSGSMCLGDKMQKARECSIALSEVFAALSVPFKVIGFTADRGEEANHTHFVNWKKSKASRIPLVTMKPMANNFDGYSIRYGAELLKKRPESNKLMLVISDGQPACSYYDSREEGIADTRNAVRDANKLFPTIGIAIDGNIEVLHSIYGSTFIHVRKTSDMFTSIGQIIKKEIKHYGE